ERAPGLFVYALLRLRFGLRLFRPVVVGRERVRREKEALRWHNHRRVLALRVEHLLEERIFGRPFGGKLVPGPEERGEELRRRAQDAYAVLFLQLLHCFGLAFLPARP